MKAYQVNKGYLDKHGRQQYELVATYLDKQKALEHCEKIVKETPLYNEDIINFDGWWGGGKYASWSILNWEQETIARFEEIEITE